MFKENPKYLREYISFIEKSIDCLDKRIELNEIAFLNLSKIIINEIKIELQTVNLTGVPIPHSRITSSISTQTDSEYVDTPHISFKNNSSYIITPQASPSLLVNDSNYRSYSVNSLSTPHLMPTNIQFNDSFNNLEQTQLARCSRTTCFVNEVTTTNSVNSPTSITSKAPKEKLVTCKDNDIDESAVIRQLNEFIKINKINKSKIFSYLFKNEKRAGPSSVYLLFSSKFQVKNLSDQDRARVRETFCHMRDFLNDKTCIKRFLKNIRENYRRTAMRRPRKQERLSSSFETDRIQNLLTNFFNFNCYPKNHDVQFIAELLNLNQEYVVNFFRERHKSFALNAQGNETYKCLHEFFLKKPNATVDEIEQMANVLGKDIVFVNTWLKTKRQYLRELLDVFKRYDILDDVMKLEQQLVYCITSSTTANIPFANNSFVNFGNYLNDDKRLTDTVAMDELMSTDVVKTNEIILVDNDDSFGLDNSTESRNLVIDEKDDCVKSNEINFGNLFDISNKDGPNCNSGFL